MRTAREVAEEFAETWGLTTEEVNDLEETIQNDRREMADHTREEVCVRIAFGKTSAEALDSIRDDIKNKKWPSA